MTSILVLDGVCLEFPPAFGHCQSKYAGDIGHGRILLLSIWSSVRCLQRLDNVVNSVALVVSYTGGSKDGLQKYDTLASE